MDVFKFQINEEWEGLRIDKYLSSNLDFLSRSYIQKMIQDKNVTVNSKIVKANYCLRLEDEIEFCLPPSVELDILAEDIPLDILYEDADVIIKKIPSLRIFNDAEDKMNLSLNDIDGEVLAISNFTSIIHLK